MCPGVGGWYMPHPSDAPDQVFDVPEALLARGGRQLVSVNEEGVHIGSDGASVHAQLHRCVWLPHADMDIQAM